jgi:hypothetical protein
MTTTATRKCRTVVAQSTWLRALLVAAIDGVYQNDFLIQTGAAIGAKAHRQDASLHLMLKELDLLGTLLLRGAELVAAKYKPRGTRQEGLAVARRIATRRHSSALQRP